VVTYQHGTSFVQKKIINNLPATSYALSDDATTPKTGLDCTGLIVRAAQIVGIPYFFKNSTTIGALMRPLQPHESLHAGDIILVRGHVMIVADTKRNTLVEARGQDHGYGKVHEIPLKNVFKGMTTFDDLQTAHATQKRLIRFDSRGVERNTFATFSLFSLASVWDAHTPQ
jgi:hypothetical protein